jgi:uncharacterized membrane protein
MANTAKEADRFPHVRVDSIMSELVLAAYDREDTAAHVLGVLRAHSDELPADLDSATIVRVGTDGGSRSLRQTYRARANPLGSALGVAL